MNNDYKPWKNYGRDKETHIKPIEYFDKYDTDNVVQGSPKKFLDLASGYHISLGNKTSHNSGEISGLTDVHSEDPAKHNINFKTHTINWEEKPPKVYPIKYVDGVFGTYDDGSLRIIDHEKFRLTDRNMGFHDGVKYVAKDRPRYGAGKDERNKVLGTGKDNREPIFIEREMKKGMYDSKGRLIGAKEDRNRTEIFRGDELGHVEFYKRKLRRGDRMETPSLTIRGGQVTSHEGRHRSRAMMEEGIREMPINLEDSKLKDIREVKGQQNSLIDHYPDHAYAFGADKRNPINTPSHYSLKEQLNK